MLDNNQNILYSGGGETIASPPLWKSGPRPHYRAVTSTKRSQEIAKDREKLMELIQNMPEDSYELSLKDIVDKPQILHQNPTILEENINQVKKKVNNNKLFRSGSMNSPSIGLKLFFPTSLGTRKSPKLSEKKKSNNPTTMVKSSSSNGRTGRCVLDLLPSCWSFFSKQR